MRDLAPTQRGRYRLHPAADDVTRRRVGDPKDRGGLERNCWLFRLLDGLTAPGAMPLPDAAYLVFGDWDRQVSDCRASAETTDKYKSLSTGLFRLAANPASAARQC